MLAYAEYVRQTALLLNLNGFSGGNMLTSGGDYAGATYPWFFNVSDDALTNGGTRTRRFSARSRSA